MQYPSCFTGGTAFLAALCLSACAVTEPSVSYSDFASSQVVVSKGVSLQLGAAREAAYVADAGEAPQSYWLSFDVTTAAQGGRYQSKNIGAIWIETPTGNFEKTLELWAKTRRRYLTKYKSAAGTTGAVDVTASAKLSNHSVQHVSWDDRDRAGTLLEAGAYRLRVEVTDSDATGKSYGLDFDTSAGAQRLTPGDQPYFKSLVLSIQ